MPNRGDHVVVSSWSDVDSAPDTVSGRDKQNVATVFRDQSWDAVVWIPDWLLDDGEREVVTIEGSDSLAVGDVESYSDKAWRFDQPHTKGETGGFLPKSQVIVFERGPRLEELDTPQQGLTDF